MAERDAARRAAAAVWRFRARAELEASARFSRLAEELTMVGAVSPVIAMAREAAADELRHADLCESLARELDGASFDVKAARAAQAPPRSVAPGSFNARERALYEVVAMSCITETLSAALLGEMVERATDAAVRDVMQAILRDEVSHARLGWAHLAAESQRGDASILGDYLPVMLSGTVQEELFSSWAEHPERAALSGLGALDREGRRQVFEGTMRLVVFPGLQRFGVDTKSGEKWIAARR